jgi:Pentapeptide repeats (8 copies)
VQRAVVDMRNSLRIDEFVLGLLALVVLGFAVTFLFDEDTRVQGATLLGGLVVAAGTYRTVQVTREGHITDRFAKSIGQLGDEVAEVRLGGIYALERIAWDSRRDHGTVMEVLTAYVRKCAPRQTRAETRDEKRCDKNSVQAAIAVLGRRNVRHDPPEGRADARELREKRRLDLSSTDLRGVKFGEGDFGRAILRGTDLGKADLHGTNLRDAELQGAELIGANLVGADLEGAKCEGAIFQGAHYDANTTRWPDGPDSAAHASDNPDGSCHWCEKERGRAMSEATESE